jgi:hypothetical protein
MSLFTGGLCAGMWLVFPFLKRTSFAHKPRQHPVNFVFWDLPDVRLSQTQLNSTKKCQIIIIHVSVARQIVTHMHNCWESNQTW